MSKYIILPWCSKWKKSWPIIIDLVFFFVVIWGVIWTLQASTETIRWEKYAHGVVLICHRSNTIMIIPLDLPALLKLSISFHRFQLRSSIVILIMMRRSAWTCLADVRVMHLRACFAPLWDEELNLSSTYKDSFCMSLWREPGPILPGFQHN